MSWTAPPWGIGQPTPKYATIRALSNPSAVGSAAVRRPTWRSRIAAGLFVRALVRHDRDRAPGLEQDVLADRSGHHGPARVGGQHDELRMRLAGRLDDHLSGKPRRDADIGLPGFITEFMVDRGAQFRLDGGLLFPLGVH